MSVQKLSQPVIRHCPRVFARSVLTRHAQPRRGDPLCACGRFDLTVVITVSDVDATASWRSLVIVRIELGHDSSERRRVSGAKRQGWLTLRQCFT